MAGCSIWALEWEEMHVTIKLYAALRDGRFSEQQKSYEPGITVQGVMDDLGIASGDAPVVFVNGRNADNTILLHDEDVIAIFPAIGGG
jgi:molybdopterin synthase sulfur carrier subunit